MGHTADAGAQRGTGCAGSRCRGAARAAHAAGATARALANEMDFSFLLKPHRMLLSIGYNVS